MHEASHLYSFYSSLITITLVTRLSLLLAPKSLCFPPCSRSLPPAMNARDFALVSSAALLGAMATSMAMKLFCNPKNHASSSYSSSNGTANGGGATQSPFDPSKRKGYISWDDYFMAIAFLSSQRSKDPNRQVRKHQPQMKQVSIELTEL